LPLFIWTPEYQQFLRLGIVRVTDDFTLHEVNDFFGDVCGVISQAQR
jgi:hypothetical protein